MSARLIVDCGVADTRAAYMINDEAHHFWIGPARGDEKLPRPPQTGDIFAGRVKSVSKALGGAFVDIGAAREGFLPFAKGATPPVEGAAVIVMARRPAIDAKGAVLTLDWRQALEAGAAEQIVVAAKTIDLGALGQIADAAVEAVLRCRLRARGREFAVIANSAAAKTAIEADAATPVSIDASAHSKFQIDDAIAQSLEPSATLASGARIHFYETAAGALIDVDSASAAAGASARLNDKTNEAALARVFCELTRREIGGRVVVDFLPPSGAPARATLAAALRDRLTLLAGAHFGALARDGLFHFTLPRRHLSLLEQASEPAADGLLIAGRRYTLDWAAKSAMRALERALAARPAARPRLAVSEEIGRYLVQSRPQWAERARARYGARFEIATAPKLERRHYDVIE